MRTAKIGDKISAMGITVTIAVLFYSDYDERDGWDIEFKDEHGKYRHWKQVYDGGEYLPN